MPPPSLMAASSSEKLPPGTLDMQVPVGSGTASFVGNVSTTNTCKHAIASLSPGGPGCTPGDPQAPPKGMDCGWCRNPIGDYTTGSQCTLCRTKLHDNCVRPHLRDVHPGEPVPDGYGSASGMHQASRFPRDTPPRPGSRLPRDIAGGGTAPGPSAAKAGTGLHITSLPFSAEGWRHCGEAIIRSVGGSVARRRPLPSCSQAEVDLGQTCRLLHAWFHTRFDPLFNEAPSTAAEDVATIAEPLKAMTHTSHSTRVVRCSRAAPP